jgi:hypothetical protein
MMLAGKTSAIHTTKYPQPTGPEKSKRRQTGRKKQEQAASLPSSHSLIQNPQNQCSMHGSLLTLISSLTFWYQGLASLAVTGQT